MHWLKFFPIELRSSKHLPREGANGPYIKPKFRKTWKLGELNVRLKIPPASFLIGTKGFNRLNKESSSQQAFRHVPFNTLGPDNHSKNLWKCNTFIERDWLWTHPWFAGHAATLSFFGRVLGLKPTQNQKTNGEYTPQNCQDLTFFNPQIFEMALMDYLINNFGYNHAEKPYNFEEQFRRGPLNWKNRTTTDGLPIAEFFIENYGKNIPDETNPLFVYHYIIFPISDDRLGSLSFSFEMQRNEAVLYPSFTKFINEISETLTIEASDEIKIKLKAIQKENPGAKLSDRFSPIKWGGALHKKQHYNVK